MTTILQRISPSYHDLVIENDANYDLIHEVKKRTLFTLDIHVLYYQEPGQHRRH